MNSTTSGSADPAEIAKFEAVAHRFWDSEGEFKPLHRLNPLRTDFVAARMALPGARVLDVGCGGGLLAESLTRRGAQVTAIDLAPAMIETAQLHAAQSGLSIDYRVADIASLGDAPFDAVCCMEMLEHVADPAGFLGLLAHRLRPGGSVFVSTLNRNLKSFLLAIVGAEYVLRLLPRGTHEYERFIRPSELAGWGRAAGLHLGDLAGLHYDPFADRCSLTTDVSVNYVAQLRHGGSVN
ncbi:MAG TPA: bifunctional 2-polyprenyl-6-hydroxyphenol methylase/3-demethylubiquinol 3-O-methyltransferase UbiG [Steroidobacteraceae bacterium]|nr:bifunctional 2-polyprenyl-6-hydroxyphenol methylase/3-demethylubiquinol 3-O-methyltransferase UbiG [Steroidobacteraceae bacterium]